MTRLALRTGLALTQPLGLAPAAGAGKAIGDILRSPEAAASYGESYLGAAGPFVQEVDEQEVARYQLEATVFTCADLISKAIAQVKFTCGDPYWDAAFRKPNPFQSRYDFQYGLAWDASIFGNVYVMRPPGKRGSAGMFSTLDAVNVEPIGTLQRPQYRIRDDGKTYGADRIVHIRHGGGNQLRALGRVAGGLSRVKALAAADAEIHNVFRNGLNLMHVLHGGHADRDAVKRMLASIKAAFGQGGASRGGTVGLTGGFKLDSTKGLTPADGDMRNLRIDLIREVAGLFGVAPFAVGGNSDTKFSNTVARHQQTNSQALVPLCENIVEKFSHALGVEVTYNKMDLLNGDFAMQVELALQAAGGPVMTTNQARERYMGDGPVEGGDRLRDRADTAAMPGDRRGENDPDGSESDR